MNNAILLDQNANLIDLAKRAMFTRCGSYMGISAAMSGSAYAGQSYQAGTLYLGTRRGTPNGVLNRSNEMLYFTPMYRGSKVKCAVETTPTELTVKTDCGCIKMCFAEDSMLYIRGEGGLSLLLESRMLPGDAAKKRSGQAWECMFPGRCSLLLNPLLGALSVDAPWDGMTQSTPKVTGMLDPDENGAFLLAIEESVYAGKVRAEYPDYEAALADVTADWDGFFSKIPEFDEDLEYGRVKAAWTLWSLLVNASGIIKRPHMFMASNNVASSWQMGHNAAALRDNMPLATDLMLNMLDTQNEYGQLPDFVDDGKLQGQTLHPPTQGWTLKWIMKTHDLKKEISAENLEWIYTGYAKWADWFMLARDEDGDGIPAYDNGDECGFDDSSAFVDYDEVESPDLIAYLAQLYDALGDLAEMLDKPEEAAAWHKRGDEAIETMIQTFWDGEHFFARTARTHEKIISDSILYYLPLVLGSKLPKDIADKLVSDLMVEGRYLTPYGLATEVPTTDHFRVSGFSRGWVLSANNMLILTGMHDAGYVEEAKMIAKRYCAACAKWDSPILLNPVHGARGGFICSWPACAYIALADMIHNM